MSDWPSLNLQPDRTNTDCNACEVILKYLPFPFPAHIMPGWNCGCVLWLPLPLSRNWHFGIVSEHFSVSIVKCLMFDNHKGQLYCYVKNVTDSFLFIFHFIYICILFSFAKFMPQYRLAALLLLSHTTKLYHHLLSTFWVSQHHAVRGSFISFLLGLSVHCKTLISVFCGQR